MNDPLEYEKLVRPIYRSWGDGNCRGDCTNGGIEYQDQLHVFYSETEVAPTTKKLYDELTGIQFGDVEAPNGWIQKVEF